MDLPLTLDNATALSKDFLFQKICVSEPYFAMNELIYSDHKIVQASFIIENIGFPESFSLSSGEAGRHLAILGSCALALINPDPEKHYYLAVEAVGGNSNVAKAVHRCLDRKNKKFIVQSKAISLDLRKKSGQAEAKIFNAHGLEVSSLIITYKVFRNDLFKRLFKRFYIENAMNMAANPYTDNYPLKDVVYSNNVLTGKTGIIRPEQCAGHFDEYPALPVAMLCSLLFEMAGRHYMHKVNRNDVKYCVDRILLTANRLASAGEFLLLQSEEFVNNIENKRYIVSARDFEGNVVGKVDIVLYVE